MTNQYTVDDVRAQIKPLSKNSFVRFFQNIYRKWLGCWYGFADKHQKLAEWIYKIAFFVIFSMSVTIYQYVVMTFLPYAFTSLNNGAEGWPGVLIGSTGQYYMIFGDAKGWGYFIAFEIAVFTAQCINFPLQRNITYKSHGNPWWQAMWYFIGWVLVSIFTNAVWGICNVYLVYWGWPDAITGLIKTILTGGVSLVIFFFIFMIIFPDNNAVAKRTKAKYDKLVAAGASAEKIAVAEQKYEAAQKKADYSNAEKEYSAAVSQASNKAVRYFSFIEKSQKSNEAEGEEYGAKLQALFGDAVAAIGVKAEKEAAFNAVKQ